MRVRPFPVVVAVVALIALSGCAGNSESPESAAKGESASASPSAKPLTRKVFPATSASLKEAKVQETLAREGTETVGSASPAEFGAFIAQDAKLWARLVKESGPKTD